MVNLSLDADFLEGFCQQNHIRRMSLFGSALRQDFQEDSDVDLLVEFESGAPIGLMEMIELEAQLSARIGRQVDLRTPAELSRYIRDRVVSEATVLYAA